MNILIKKEVAYIKNELKKLEFNNMLIEEFLTNYNNDDFEKCKKILLLQRSEILILLHEKQNMLYQLDFLINTFNLRTMKREEVK